MKALLAGAALSILAAAPAFAETYDDAVAARRAGEFGRAIAILEQLLAKQPRNIDAMVLEGALLGFEKRFDEALAVLERARALAPGNTEVLLGLARIRSYRGEFAVAERDAEAVLAREPDNVDALDLAGRVAWYQNALPRAERFYAAALERQPGDLEALIGMGDVRASQGRTAEAGELYRRALAADPASKDAAERIARLASPRRQWQFDTVASWSTFARQDRERWLESFNRLTWSPDAATAVHGSAEVSRRFGANDVYYELGVDRRFDEVWSGYFWLGGTPDADFRERWAVISGGTARLSRGEDVVAATLATLDGKRALYRTGPVGTIAPGVQQYFLRGQFWASAKWINTWDALGTRSQGYSLRLDGLVRDDLRLFIGWADAPETSENVVAFTRSVFAGAVWDVTDDLILRVDYTHDDRERGYIRHALSVGLGVRF